ncbi:hypothetical protein Y032_0270g874 [Ancylostoma ceylanicum]|nr:hypothetical protein Y032_0270g874 [Ancylostoma ceylanicum]
MAQKKVENPLRRLATVRGHILALMQARSPAGSLAMHKRAGNYGVAQSGMIAERDKDFGGELEEFENEKDARPATTHIKEVKLRWKDGKERKKADRDQEQEDSGSARDPNVTAIATHILELWNEQHVLENTLNPLETRAIVDFFNAVDSFANNSNTVARLIDKAVRRSISKTLEGSPNLGFTVTEEERIFLERNFRAKRILLDVLMKNAKLLPESWASRSLYASIDNTDKRGQQRQKEVKGSKDYAGKENKEGENVQKGKNRLEVRVARSMGDIAEKVVRNKPIGKAPEENKSPPPQLKRGNAKTKKARN